MTLSKSQQAWRRALIDGYDNAVLCHPRSVLVAVALTAALCGWYAQYFRLDASADSLVIKSDPALLVYRDTNRTFGTAQSLVLAYAPKTGDLFSDAALRDIAALEAQLEALPGISDVFTLLDAPLVRSPPVPLRELGANVRSLRDRAVDKKLARQELVGSPLFSNLLISTDGAVTALQISLIDSPRARELFEERNTLRTLPASSPTQRARLDEVEREYSVVAAQAAAARHDLIAAIRDTVDVHRQVATLHLGGTPMIADDMITYVQDDLLTFGGAVLAIVTLMLFMFFGALRWVVLPLLTSFLTVAGMLGLLGMMDWPVTVVSSNFVSLLMIISISLTIHLITQFRELARQRPDAQLFELVRDTVHFKAMPCLYTALTTMVGFGSLLTSGIVPVNNFGMMMVIGVALSLLVSFTLFPALLLLLPEKAVPPPRRRAKINPLAFLAQLASRQAAWVIGASLLMAIVAAGGLMRLTVENSFVNYFGGDTEIHQGMQYIDQHLGGTMPLDVVLQLQPMQSVVHDEYDDFAVEEENPERYWYTVDKMSAVGRVHAYLESRPEVGKALSLATLDQIAASFNDGQRLDSLMLQVVYGSLPEQFRDVLVQPYANPASGRARISVRILESDPGLKRNEFLRDVQQHIAVDMGYGDTVQLSGMMVLFNNMLSQLFSSQITTLGGVLAANLLMFWLLFRRFRLAVIGVLPNVLAASLVLAAMGWFNIPLDVMTITIASICIGIGVDNAIHYIYRFDVESSRFGREGASVAGRRDAVVATHLSIGQALYFTTLTVIAGFSILVFSQFTPTVYFGVCTALAMLIALIANLSLLPAMLNLFGVKLRSSPVAMQAVEGHG